MKILRAAGVCGIEQFSGFGLCNILKYIVVMFREHCYSNRGNNESYYSGGGRHSDALSNSI